MCTGGDDRSLVISVCMSLCVHTCSVVIYIKQTLPQAISSYVLFVAAMRETGVFCWHFGKSYFQTAGYLSAMIVCLQSLL